MTEKRQHKRHRRRLNVKFGDRDFASSGLTYDVSSTGMFLVTNSLHPVRTRLHLQMFLDTQRFIAFEGEVRRQRLVPAHLRSVEKGGMGIRFLTPTEMMRELVDAGRLRVTITYPTLPSFQTAFDRELKNAVMVLRTQRPLPPGTKLMLEFVLPFIPATVEIEALVAPTPSAAVNTVNVTFESADGVAHMSMYLSGERPGSD